MRRPLRWINAAVLLSFAYFGSIVLIPLFLSIFLAIFLEPAVQSFGTLKIKRSTAAFFTVTGFVVLTLILGWIVYLGFLRIADDFPLYSSQLKSMLNEMRLDNPRFEFFKPVVDFLDAGHNPEVQQVRIVEPFPIWTQYLLRGVGSIYEVLSVAIFVPLMLYYFLIGKDDLVESLNTIVGKYFYLPVLHSELPKMVRAFFSANLVTGAILIAAHAAIFFILGLNNSAALAIFSGSLNLIPILGAPIAIIPPLVQSIAHDSPASVQIAIVVLTLVLHFVSSSVLLPYIFGTRLNLNSSAIIVGFLFWGWLWGAMGFLLAIPMTSLLKIFLESNVDTYSLSTLMAAKPRHVIRHR